MPTLMLLLFMAYAQDKSNKPAYMWAGGFAIITLILGIFEGGLIIGVVSAVVLGLYAWGYFAILRKFSDQTLLWLILCVAGLVLPFLLPLMLGA